MSPIRRSPIASPRRSAVWRASSWWVRVRMPTPPSWSATTAADREQQAAASALTPRELEVLALLAEGASNKAVARRLGISTHTAKFHVASLIEKLDAVSRTDAVAHAARLGVIHL